MSQQVVLDTDTLSLIMRKQPLVTQRAQAYLAIHKQFTFSIITRYEVLRGLHAKNATAQLLNFGLICNASQILPLTDAIVIQAAIIYADLYQRGTLVGDADILIAATALVKGWTLVTNNQNHFSRIANLQVENWLK